MKATMKAKVCQNEQQPCRFAVEFDMGDDRKAMVEYLMEAEAADLCRRVNGFDALLAIVRDTAKEIAAWHDDIEKVSPMDCPEAELYRRCKQALADAEK